MPFSCLSQSPKQFFTQKPTKFQVQSLQDHLQGMFLTTFSFFFLDFAKKILGLLDLGTFEKGVGKFDFGQKNFKFLIGLSPI